ncbi:unnamed protein product [Closterium sp. Naga37s-1]|nr:unnamed protein product [Closterium sp. Naga37s-1]
MQRRLPVLMLLLSLALLPRVLPSHASALPRTCGVAEQGEIAASGEAENSGARAGIAHVCDAREGGMPGKEGGAGDDEGGDGGGGMCAGGGAVLARGARGVGEGERGGSSGNRRGFGEGGEMAARERMLQGRGWARTLMQRAGGERPARERVDEKRASQDPFLIPAIQRHSRPMGERHVASHACGPHQSYSLGESRGICRAVVQLNLHAATQRHEPPPPQQQQPQESENIREHFTEECGGLHRMAASSCSHPCLLASTCPHQPPCSVPHALHAAREALFSEKSGCP